MIKSFLNGVGFGFGFCLAVALVLWVLPHFHDPFGGALRGSTSTPVVSSEERGKWNALSLEEKIEKSTAVAIVRFKDEEDALKAAYVEAVVKRDPSVELTISPGDRLEKADFYSQGGNNRDRDGVIVFYVRNPAVEIAQSYLYDDRLIADGDMPLHVFMKKYKKRS